MSTKINILSPNNLYISMHFVLIEYLGTMIKHLFGFCSRSGETLYKWLTILYTSIKSPLCLLQYKESKSRCCNLVSYGSCANSGTNLVALCCIRSSLPMFCAKNGFQIETKYSRCGRTYVLYSIKNDSLGRRVKKCLLIYWEWL